tara:strand:+ start:221 stop:1327 length:1107 start_codon:yes stop_codon:yes gene_type:complete
MLSVKRIRESMSDTNENELFRYIEYLQNELVAEGSESFIRNERDWFINSREKIKASLEAKLGDGKEPHPIALKIDSFEGKTKFESFFSSESFKPLLDDVTKIYEELDVTLSATVDLFTSPGLSPGACARPSIFGHTIFAGEGTMSFCNYWSKIFISVVIGATSESNSELDEVSINQAIAEHDIGIKTFCLTAYYSQLGSLKGFGKLSEPKGAMLERASLVQAMEVFIIAHEFYHLHLEEQYPDSNGLPPDTSQKEMELMCDSWGLVVLTLFGLKHNNIYATNLIAPLVFFSSLELCESTRVKLKPEVAIDDSHPSPLDRLTNINEFIENGNFPEYMKDSSEKFTRISVQISKRLDKLVEAYLFAGKYA